MSSHYIVLVEPLQCVSFSRGPSIIINWPECLRTQKLRLPWWSDGGIYGRPPKSRIPNWRMWRWWQRRRSDWESYRIGIRRSSWHTDWRAHTLAATSKHLLRTNKPLRFSVVQQIDFIISSNLSFSKIQKTGNVIYNDAQKCHKSARAMSRKQVTKPNTFAHLHIPRPQHPYKSEMGMSPLLLSQP